MGRFFTLMLIASSVASAGNAAPLDTDISSEEETELHARLLKAGELINAQQPTQAMTEHLNPVIARYESVYGKSKDAVFCATEPAEGLFYTVSIAAAQEQGASPQDAIVLGPTWSDAYLLKGYALVELKDFSAAHAVLESAVKLSPQNPQYMSELAFVKEQMGESEQALALFQSAEEAAEIIEDPGRKLAEKSRACRGQGYALVELKRMDDADAKYRSCLEIDPNDERSKGELEYIRKNRNQ